MSDNDARDGLRSSSDGPTHPRVRAAVLMVAVVLLLVALSVSSLVRW
jgi:hypothetical protein